MSDASDDVWTDPNDSFLVRAERDRLRARVERLEKALTRLAGAADNVGVHHFDTDTMSAQAEEMQRATAAARAALKEGGMIDFDRLEAGIKSGVTFDELMMLRALRLARAADAAEQSLEAIRCNSEPNCIGGYCDLPEETAPHTPEEHHAAHIRAINSACRAALTLLREARNG